MTNQQYAFNEIIIKRVSIPWPSTLLEIISSLTLATKNKKAQETSFVMFLELFIMLTPIFLYL